jgi:hypothetical protein
MFKNHTNFFKKGERNLSLEDFLFSLTANLRSPYTNQDSVKGSRFIVLFIEAPKGFPTCKLRAFFLFRFKHVRIKIC